MQKKTYFGIAAGLLLAILVFTVAYATTIDVDGSPADWPEEAWLVTDPSDVLFPGGDLSDIYFTNDATNLYWRFDTYAATDWMELDTVFICMDTDNNQGTGTSDCCDGAFTSDYTLLVMEGSLTLRDQTGGGCDPIAGTGSAATAGSTTEVQILLSDVDITSDRTIPSEIMAMMSGDQVQDLSPQIPGPTAVRVQSLTVQSAGARFLPGTVFLGAAALLALWGLGVWRRRLHR